MRLDHVSYAAGREQVVDVVERLGATLGGGLVDGGRHPRFGTCNFVLPLAGSCYLEVVSALDHPSVDAAPFGQAVRRRAAAGGGWLGWVVAVDDLAPVERRLGRPAVAGNRRRPDGHELRWRQLGVLGLLADPSLPFFVQWLGPASDHPSAGTPTDVRIERLEVSGDRDTLRNWLGRPVRDPLPDIALDWVDAAEPGLVAVHFATPRGSVRID